MRKFGLLGKSPWESTRKDYLSEELSSEEEFPPELRAIYL